MKNIVTLIVVFLTTISFAQEVKFGKVSKAELEEKFYPTDSVSEAAYLYRYRNTRYDYKKNEGFVIINEFHIRAKIYNKEGLKKANFQVGYYKPDKGSKERIKDIKGYTFNLENGKVVKTKLSKSNIFDDKVSKYRALKKIAMPAVKEGAIIDLKYTVVSPYVQTIDDLKFQFDIPVKQLDYQIEHPEYFVFNKTPKGYYIIPFRESKREGSISFGQSVSWTDSRANVQNNGRNLMFHKETYKANDIPALRSGEPFVSNIRNYRGGMKYELSATKYPNSVPKMYTTSWAKVVSQIYKSPSFGGELSKGSFYKDDLQTLLANANSDNEKIVAIFEFVKSKVKWNGYYGKYADVSVRKAYKEGTGNVATINLLLTSMLREAGFDANPVLTSTRANGIPILPTRDGFNYVIASVTTANGVFLLDASEKYSAVNTLPFRAMNWNGRLVRKDGTSASIPLTPKRHALEDRFVNVKLSDDGTIEGMMRTKYTGLRGLNYRKRNNGLKEEDVITKLEDSYAIEVDNFKVTNAKNSYKPLARLFKFSSEDLVEGIGGKMYVNPLLFLAYKTNPFKINERKYPVDFGIPWKEKNTISIEIPEGYTVESIPAVAAIGLPDGLGLFKYQVKQTGNKIKIISLLQFNEGVIVPKYYDQLKEFFKQVVEKQTEKIVMTKS